MEDIDLENILHELNGSISWVVCSSDELKFIKSIQNKPCVIISNTEPRNMPGRHWIAFFYNPGKVIEFFDSFGKEPLYYNSDFELFLSKYSNIYSLSTKQIQNDNSNVCGLYCILYYYSKLQKEPFYEFINIFGNNTNANDVYCLQQINALLDYNIPVQQ